MRIKFVSYTTKRAINFDNDINTRTRKLNVELSDLISSSNITILFQEIKFVSKYQLISLNKRPNEALGYPVCIEFRSICL